MEPLFPVVFAFLAVVMYLCRWTSYPSTTKHSETKSMQPQSRSHSDPKTDLVTKELDLPADWLTSRAICELEKRAIFSKEWLPLTFTPLFPSPGIYHTTTPAGIPLFVIKSKDSKIRAFHNVCRHRAYPVINTERNLGKSLVLACRYHGWSYDSCGKLIKAPKFDGLEGFERSQNGLFQVRAKVINGVVWVNLSMEETDEDDGEVEEGMGTNVRMVEDIGIDIGKFSWIGGGGMEGEFNWKMALPIKHLTNALGIEHISASPSLCRSLIHTIQRSFHLQEESKPSSTYLFPNMFLFSIPSLECLISLSILPLSERTTSVRYDLYSHSQGGSNARELSSLLGDLESKIKNLISGLERAYLNHSSVSSRDSTLASTSGHKLLDLYLESSSTQTRILTHLKDHAKLERSLGEEIYPAKREPRVNARYEQAEKRLANKLTSTSLQRIGLPEWWQF
ncbi:Rieske [2Fe-2S] iron-sulfur domain-containing protein [Aspergillus nidulans var. acristatus]